MKACIGKAASQEKGEGHAGVLRARYAPDMTRARCSQIVGRGSSCGRPCAKVYILIIEEKARVEPVEIFEEGTANHESGAHHLSHGTGCGVIARGQKILRKPD